jgi:triphosphoribosyl-dephospho-CoA synthase
MVLLLAPLATAAARLLERALDASRERSSGTPWTRAVGACDLAALRGELEDVLGATTVDDARDVFAAIRLAAPGGLGRVAAEDVAGEPTVTLIEAMRLAADRDAVASEYASTYDVTFRRGVPALRAARRGGLPWDDAVVETFLTLLAASPDTHIARRAGAARAAVVSRQAADTLRAGGVRTGPGRQAIRELDVALRDPGHLGNAGATADLTAASLLVVLLSGGWEGPGVQREEGI